MFEPLPEDLARALSHAAPRIGAGARLRFVSETGSTNDEALTLAQDDAPDGTAVIADAQRAGRGRRGRVWFSPPGSGVYLSVVVRVGPAPVTLSLVTLAAGVAAADAITAASGLPVELKWPNDLVVGRSWRKIGGVLCESVGGAQVSAVVVGIGINRAAEAYPPDLAGKATSIETELGRPIDRAPLVVECLVRVAERMVQIRAGEDAEICREWRRLGRGGFGRPVRWHDQSVERIGVARDIDAAGALVVESEGRTERLVAGEVFWDRRSHV